MSTLWALMLRDLQRYSLPTQHICCLSQRQGRHVGLLCRLLACQEKPAEQYSFGLFSKAISSDRREGSGHSRPYPLPFPSTDSLIITTNILHTALGLVRYSIINVSLPTLVSIQPSRASRRYRSPPTPEHAH